MKKFQLTALVTATFAAVAATSSPAQTNVLLDGTSGTNTFTNNYSVSAGLSQINLSLGFFADYLVVGGGGSGGTAGDTSGTGGGGAGGLLQGSAQLSSSNYSVIVGAGGAAPNTSGSSSVQGVSGSNSVFGSLTALGGGGGGRFNQSGGTGGSGGGAGGRASTAGGPGTANQGFAGGSARSGSTGGDAAGGGGGGGASAGTNASGNNGGAGGAGLASSITGSSVTYAGGGGGGGVSTSGAGGAGGGGAGSSSGAGSSGVAGLGGGGGGAKSFAQGGNGGSGVVIVRYHGDSVGDIGGTVTAGTGSAAGYTLHTFTTTGSANFDLSGPTLNNRLGATISGNVTAARVDYNGPGTLTLAGSSNSAFSGGLYANSGTLRLTGTMQARNLFIANPSNATASVVVDGGDLRVSNFFGFEVGQRGNGSLTVESGSLTSANSYVGYNSSRGEGGGTNSRGTATVNGGQWSAENLWIGTSGSGTLNVNGGTVSGSSLSVGTFSNGNGVVNVTGGNLTNRGAISVGAQRSSGSGEVNVTGGTLSGSTMFLYSTSTLNISDSGTVALAVLNAESANAAVHVETGGTLRLSGGFSSVVANPSGILVNGTLALSNTWFQGHIRIGSGGTNGSLSGNFLLDSTGGVISSVTFDRSDNTSYTGNMSGLGSLIKEGAGTLTLSGTNGFRGDTLVNDGTLLLGSSRALGNASVVKVSTNGTLQADERVVIGYLDVDGGTVVGGDNLVSALTLVNSGTVAGLADGVDFAAGMIKRTAGVATVDGANAFTGVIRVEGGTLQMTNGGSFAPASSLLLSNAATVDLNGISQQFSSVNGGGTLALGSGTLTVGGSESSDFSGTISGPGALVKSGPGTMTLSGAATHGGATTVDSGELRVNGSLSGAVSVQSSGRLSGSGSVGTISGAGAVDPGNSPGILTAPSVDPSGGLTFNFEFTSLNPVFSDASSSVNDLLRLTGGTPFTASLASVNTVNIYFNADSFGTGQAYTGGFFTDTQGDFLADIIGANFIYYVADENGAIQYNGVSYDLIDGSFDIMVTTTAQSGADFAGGTVDGRITQFEVVPEPSTWALLVLAASGLGVGVLRRRRR